MTTSNRSTFDNMIKYFNSKSGANHNYVSIKKKKLPTTSNLIIVKPCGLIGFRSL